MPDQEFKSPDDVFKYRGYTDDQINEIGRGNLNVRPGTAKTPEAKSTGGALDYFTGGPGSEIAKATAKGLGSLALDVGEFATVASPQAIGPLRDEALRTIEKGREYTRPSEDEPMYATPFRWAGEYLPLSGFGPVRGLGALRPLERMASKVMPPTKSVTQLMPRIVPQFTAGGGFAPTMQSVRTTTQVPSTAGKVAQAAARYVGDPALTGGAVGAVSDPEHPGQGFLHGLETGLAMSGGEMALKGPLGALARYIATHYAAKGMGIPWHPGGHLLQWLASKAQGKMARSPERLTERLGPPAARVVSKTLTGPPDEELERERQP